MSCSVVSITAPARASLTFSFTCSGRLKVTNTAAGKPFLTFPYSLSPVRSNFAQLGVSGQDRLRAAGSTSSQRNPCYCQSAVGRAMVTKPDVRRRWFLAVFVRGRLSRCHGVVKEKKLAAERVGFMKQRIVATKYRL